MVEGKTIVGQPHTVMSVDAIYDRPALDLFARRASDALCKKLKLAEKQSQPKAGQQCLDKCTAARTSFSRQCGLTHAQCGIQGKRLPEPYIDPAAFRAAVTAPPYSPKTTPCVRVGAPSNATPVGAAGPRPV